MKSCLFIGDLPLDSLFFLRLENAFLLSENGAYIEVISNRDDLEYDLSVWAKFKGEGFLGKQSLSKHSKGNFVYTFIKHSHTRFARFSHPHIAPDAQGLAPYGVRIESGSPHYHFRYEHDNEIFSPHLDEIYEDAKKHTWNASKDIKWQEIPPFSPKLQFAIAQIMTYLVENEFSALYIPSQFLAQISPYFTSVPLLLASIIGDEARHIESFIKRANVTSLGVQYSTLATQQSLYSLYKQKDYFKSSFLLHVMGEGTFIDLLAFLEESFRALGDEASAHLLYLARRDEARHVRYGMSNITHSLAQNPAKINMLKEVVFERKNYLSAQSSESTLLLESMALLRGGGEERISQGFEEVLALKQKMEKNRTKRLVECGIDEELALDLSKAHTPNFM